MTRIEIISDQRGQMLPGLLIGATCFLITALGLYFIWPVMVRNTHESWNRSQSVLVAQNKLEELKAGAVYLGDGKESFGLSREGLPEWFHPVCSYEITRMGRLVELKVSAVWGDAPGQKVLLATQVRVP